MFQNNDWNIDENYMNDFNKNLKKFQVTINKQNIQIKQAVTKSPSQLSFLNSNIQQFKNTTNLKFNDICYRKNKILNMLNTDVKKNKQSVLFHEKNYFSNSNKKKILSIINSPYEKIIKSPRIQKTIIRNFPGPAGLLPDDIDMSKMLDMSMDYKDIPKKSLSIEIYSQNTKKFFSTGAWKQMMDDLPRNIALFNIATIKEKAVEISTEFKKIPYLAGIIQYIDYNSNNPNILLKDLSGQINACIHHSICKTYPNILGINTVILVKDVGLIVTSKNYVCIIVSKQNLVSIYSDDLRLVKTNLMEK